jgi:hypothetical protein
MELLNVMSIEPFNTSQACPLIMDEEDKGQTQSRAVNKKKTQSNLGSCLAGIREADSTSPNKN